MISIIPIPATKARDGSISSINAIVCHIRRPTTHIFENDPSFERSQLVADNQFLQVLQLCYRFVESHRMTIHDVFILLFCSCLFCCVGIRLG
jgi:hypothetical protein